MDFVQLILFALLQGITEFLPISSSAHLALLPLLNDSYGHDLYLDVAAHSGTLTAVIYYFWHDIKTMTTSGIRTMPWRKNNTEANLFWFIILTTIPVIATGFFGYGLISTYLRGPVVIATTTILFALLLWWYDATGTQQRNAKTICSKDIICIGIAQAIALIPGTSRAGITITAALMLGFDRQTSVRFSLLLSIPTLFCAGCYTAFLLIQKGNATNFIPCIIVAIVSSLVAHLTIKFFLTFVARTGMLPYVIYRCVLGSVLLYFFF